MFLAGVDDGPLTSTCRAIWTEPGLRVVRWFYEGTGLLDYGRRRETAHLEVRLQADTTCHVAVLLRTRSLPVSYGEKPPLGHHHSLQ